MQIVDTMTLLKVLRNSASSDEPFKPEATVFETKTEFRPDLKSNLTINTRMANLSAIEMTGVGRQFADDVDLYQFQVILLQTRCVRWRSFFEFLY